MASTKRKIEAVPLVDLQAQYATIREEVRAALDRVLDSQYFILGPEVEALERDVAQYSHCKFGIGVSSGSDALLVCLMAIGLKPGDEVVTTPYTFFATAGAVSRLGGRPVFVDIDGLTYNIDPTKIEAVITSKTRAIIPVHLYGQMADMNPIMEIARKRNLIVIEDAAQAIGAEYEGRRAGSIGDFGCFSFFPSKNLGGFGDGGMVTVQDAHLADRIRLLRNHGYRPKYYNSVVGGNFRLDAIQAAILGVKLKYLDEWTAMRQRNVARYCNFFKEVEITGNISPQNPNRANATFSTSVCDPEPFDCPVSLPWESRNARHIYNQFVIRAHQREELMTHLREHNIGTEIYYPVPMHLQQCFAELRYQAGDFPVSERAARETLALPIYPELTEEQQRSVVSVIAEFYKSAP